MTEENHRPGMKCYYCDVGLIIGSTADAMEICGQPGEVVFMTCPNCGAFVEVTKIDEENTDGR